MFYFERSVFGLSHPSLWKPVFWLVSPVPVSLVLSVSPRSLSFIVSCHSLYSTQVLNYCHTIHNQALSFSASCSESMSCYNTYMNDCQDFWICDYLHIYASLLALMDLPVWNCWKCFKRLFKPWYTWALLLMPSGHVQMYLSFESSVCGFFCLL